MKFKIVSKEKNENTKTMTEVQLELLLSRLSQDIAYMGLRIQRDITKCKDKLNSTHDVPTFCYQLADILKKNSEYIEQFNENLHDRIEECNLNGKYSEVLNKLKSISSNTGRSLTANDHLEGNSNDATSSRLVLPNENNVSTGSKAVEDPSVTTDNSRNDVITESRDSSVDMPQNRNEQPDVTTNNVNNESERHEEIFNSLPESVVDIVSNAIPSESNDECQLPTDSNLIIDAANPKNLQDYIKLEIDEDAKTETDGSPLRMSDVDEEEDTVMSDCIRDRVQFEDKSKHDNVNCSKRLNFHNVLVDQIDASDKDPAISSLNRMNQKTVEEISTSVTANLQQSESHFDSVTEMEQDSDSLPDTLLNSVVEVMEDTNDTWKWDDDELLGNPQMITEHNVVLPKNNENFTNLLITEKNTEIQDLLSNNIYDTNSNEKNHFENDCGEVNKTNSKIEENSLAIPLNEKPEEIIFCDFIKQILSKDIEKFHGNRNKEIEIVQLKATKKRKSSLSKTESSDNIIGMHSKIRRISSDTDYIDNGNNVQGLKDKISNKESVENESSVREKVHNNLNEELTETESKLLINILSESIKTSSNKCGCSEKHNEIVNEGTLLNFIRNYNKHLEIQSDLVNSPVISENAEKTINNFTLNENSNSNNYEKMDSKSEDQQPINESYFCEIAREEIVDINNLKNFNENSNSETGEIERTLNTCQFLFSDESFTSDDDIDNLHTSSDLIKKYNLKDFHVNLEEMCFSKAQLREFRKSRMSSESDIEKLCDVTTILKKNKKQSGNRTRTKKKRKNKTILDTSSEDSSDFSDNNSESELSDGILDSAINNVKSDIQSNQLHDDVRGQNDFLNNLIENIGNSSDENKNYDDTDFNWSSDEDALSGKKKKRRSSGEQSKKMPRVGSSITVHSSESDLEIMKPNGKDKSKKKWRHHPLLVIDTSDDSTTLDNDQDDNKESASAKKTCDALKRFEMKYLPRVNNNSTKKRKEWDIIISSEDDSDIEFVSIIPNSQDTAHNISETQSQRGRRNIRALVEDSDLAASTKRAKQEEENRIKRLQAKQKNKELSFSMTYDHSRSFSTSQESQMLECENPLILDLNEEVEIRVNDRIATKLKDHQRNGIQFMWDSCYESIEQLNKNWKGSGCILAHCMGLGKTLQALALIQTLYKYNKLTKTKHILIICPLSIVSNWKKEYEIMMKHVNEPRISIYVIESKLAVIKRINLVRKWHEKGGMLIIGYEGFRALTTETKLNNWEQQQFCKKSELMEALIDPGPDLVICDEGHLLRNKQTERNLTLNRIKTRRKIILTGTPLQNNLLEYYCMVHLVKPNLLGTEKEFKTNFVNPISNGQYEDSTAVDILLMKKRTHILHEILNKTVQRMEVTELHKYLPKIIDHALFFKLTELQIKFYNTYLDYRMSNAEYARNGTINSRTFLSDVLVLNLICTHPYLISLANSTATGTSNDDAISKNEWCQELLANDSINELTAGTKMTFLLELLKEVDRENEKALIFSQSYPEMDALEYFLVKHMEFKKNFNYFRMDGTTLPNERSIMCDKFNDPNNTNMKVFIMSTKVGGLGLNLTAANRVIIMSVHWNPSYDTQSIFRTYRFGQQKTVYVYRLIAMDTMEEKRYQRQVTKLAIAHRVVDKHQITRHYNSNDIHAMYSVRPQIAADRPLTKVPEDKVLGKLFQKYRFLHKWHEHQALLENRPEEDLNEQQKNAAWEEFNKRLNEPEPRLIPNHHQFVHVPFNTTINTTETDVTLADPLETNNISLSHLLKMGRGGNEVRTMSINDFQSDATSSLPLPPINPYSTLLWRKDRNTTNINNRREKQSYQPKNSTKLMFSQPSNPNPISHKIKQKPYTKLRAVNYDYLNKTISSSFIKLSHSTSNSGGSVLIPKRSPAVLNKVLNVAASRSQDESKNADKTNTTPNASKKVILKYNDVTIHSKT